VHVFYIQSIRYRLSDLATQTLSTRDGHTVVLGASVGYSINDLQKLYTTLHHAEGTVRQHVMGTLADVVQAWDRVECTPGQLATEAARQLRISLAPYGLGDVQVRITDFAYVQTFRLIQDQRWGSSYDNLDTILQGHRSP
jgi:regulator of protease activity HflC (stomatin/prohibitin superfamily)